MDPFVRLGSSGSVFGGIVRSDGLNVVMLGPFSRRGAAEDAARHVHETLGLVPLVLRSNLR